MSKLGKKPVIIPSGVNVEPNDGHVLVTGPKGSLLVKKLDGVEMTISGNEITLQLSSSSRQAKMNLGTLWSLLGNAVKGVSEGFFKNLEIEGVGFKVAIEGENLVLKVGFSHPVVFPIPKGVLISVEKNKILISGIDKQEVGQVAAKIRKIKRPEPYLGKGIRYEGEVIRRKDGKKAGAAA